MELNDYGMVAARAWLHNTNISPHIEFNHFIVMPNHMHGIVIINHRDAILGVRPTQTIGSIIRRYTTTTTRQINIIRNTPGMPVWQNNYHEHMIRNEFELHTIRGHIRNNPVHWAFDKDNPLNIQIDP
ncbi:MAG: hypothetical protein JSW20_00120 [Nitrospiraceae bacterium]|nr:MAG: hypothetical protein JSW20_00120 [Nitrospiraceae bacterium]